MKHLIRILSVLLCMHLACKAEVIMDSDNSDHDLHRYLWANYYEFDKNLEKAHQLYEDILKTPGTHYAQKGYLHLLYKSGKFDQMITLMKELETQNPDLFKADPETEMLYATALKKSGKKAESDELLITLSRNFPTSPEIIFHATEIFLQRKEPENALNAVEKYLNTAAAKPNNYVFHFLKGQILAQMGQFEKALTSIQESLKSYPQFDKGWLLYAVLQEQMGKLQDAIKGYSSYLQHTQEANQHIEKHLMQLVLMQKSKEENKAVIVMEQSCLEKALSFMQQKQLPQALEQVNVCLQQKPHDMKSRLLKIQILTSLKRTKDAINQLVTWIKAEPRENVWYTTLHLLVRIGVPAQEVIAGFTTVHTQQPTNIQPVLYLADLYARAHNTDAALTFLRKGLSMAKEPILQTQLAYQIGIIYYERKQYSNLQEVLTQGINLKQEFAPLLNLAAYYYATKGKDLAKAHDLIKRVLAVDPHNPHFLDTQAVVYYKEKKFDAARDILVRIAKANPSDSMIKIHLAKVEFKKGNTSGALDTIKSAQGNVREGYEKCTVEKLCKKWSLANS